ncbi:Putative mycofactocin biosynthesis glycosyltransferase MftF [Fundidesulfovibrio magnetotacticus]|uniref:Mycofactocin biosynthesis glycosyltransferase MftF n=1 Tax=Fundidesulfovibrio magnetotacticus TaxID=2730080 RepID=A0A6V8LU32_9BACT|nr:glycosyltransferase [Fundidesulfovibrio magnetotacticus]GFK95982.1 Putative mycofactocin biosynthesis glycosyltransferase MftF [Fundidesulfovibrio magnetotacticus]
MSDTPLFSIIIPFKAPGLLVEECLAHIFELQETRYEVILLPDEPMPEPKGVYARPGVSVLPTGPVSPAVKRDMGAQAAQGQYLAFIDDDAYPEPYWLTYAREAFERDQTVVAVGGPAQTPASDPFFARASGAVFLSRLSGGFPQRYLPLPPRRFVDDWPTVNLMVRREAFLAAGGFGNEFWPGEDTKFCMDLIAKTGGRILYLPEMLVWHHRREGLCKHLRQVGNYGAHRGFFARNFPGTSRRLPYFMPSLLLLFLTVGAVLLPCSVWWAGVKLYCLALLVAAVDIARREPLDVTLAAVPYIVLTHLWYGWRFLRGWFTNDLKSTLGR